MPWKVQGYKMFYFHFQGLICVSPEVSRVNMQFQLFSIYIEEDAINKLIAILE
jgi:hypothetical protein